MINSLFNIFDPSSYVAKTAWLLPASLLILKSSALFKSRNTGIALKFIILQIVEDDYKSSLINNKKSTTSFILALFITILVLNVSSIYPHTFSVTRQAVPVILVTIPAWLAINVMSLKNDIKSIMSHLVPLGTPTPLINFIVLIEMTRNIIRPITLSIRLIANIVAGHLLLSLLGGATIAASHLVLLSIPACATLCMLELAVSFIQSYVLTTLLILYLKESM
jgi:F-type H+-transporting ATPase subunit a